MCGLPRVLKGVSESCAVRTSFVGSGMPPWPPTASSIHRKMCTLWGTYGLRRRCSCTSRNLRRSSRVIRSFEGLKIRNPYFFVFSYLFSSCSGSLKRQNIPFLSNFRIPALMGRPSLIEAIIMCNDEIKAKHMGL